MTALTDKDYRNNKLSLTAFNIRSRIDEFVNTLYQGKTKTPYEWIFELQKELAAVSFAADTMLKPGGDSLNYRAALIKLAALATVAELNALEDLQNYPYYPRKEDIQTTGASDGVVS